MEVWPERHRPWLAGAIGAASNLGMLLVGVIAAFVPVTVASWRWMFLVGASPALLTFLIRLLVPESEKWEHARDAVGEKLTPLREVFRPPILGRMLIGIVLACGAHRYLGLGPVDSALGGPAHRRRRRQCEGPRADALLTRGGRRQPAGPDAARARLAAKRLLLALRMFARALCVSLSDAIQYNGLFLATVFAVGAATAAFYGFFPLYLPEFFPTRARATGQGICYNFGRIIAAAGVLGSGALVQHYGGYARMGAIITLVYLVGMIAIWFAPETAGKPLPE